MNREILLLEPNYRNKYPPIGLMKLSTYYKALGDHVTFFKGNLSELVLRDTFALLKTQLYANDDSIFWEQYQPQICQFLKQGRQALLKDVPLYDSNPIIKDLFRYYRQFYHRKDYFQPEFRKYDRVGITTLFTFYWDITIETINFGKMLCKTEDGVMVGGVMATILADHIQAHTGIVPHKGPLTIPGQLDPGNTMIIDALPLDYSILEEIDYQYPASNAYYAYMTRGCVNKCSFCAVPTLEPVYTEYLPISDQIRTAEKQFGAKRDLLLLDNNVLASASFDAIIDDIKKAGFGKDDVYTPPNLYELAVQNLRSGLNDRGYIRACVKQFHLLLEKTPEPTKQMICDLLRNKYLLEMHTASKTAILETYPVFKPYFEKLYRKTKRRRYLDFNQGLDARLVTDANMQKLSEIPIKPVRIAFDHWSLRKTYEKAVRIAVKHGHKTLSNYLLYNYMDKPIDLYRRLKLNIDLCETLDADIYSFPMKYHPISDPDYFQNRDYIGKHWNRKFIRAIQAVLNSTKGTVGRGRSFFHLAFGATEAEFYKILYMPEAMIIYRSYFEQCGLTDKWWNAFCALNAQELKTVKSIVEQNDFRKLASKTRNPNILHVLSFYRITRAYAERKLGIKPQRSKPEEGGAHLWQ